jgi:hypothetical protein
MHHHVEHSDKPLVSSDIQTDQGHKMWHTFAKESLDKGHHVYYHHGDSIVKLNKENLDEYHKKYFGDHLRNEDTNLIVSKHEIDNKHQEK